VSLIVAPQAAGLPTTPYLTTAEFRAQPTDIDLTSLVPRGSQLQQDDVLAQVIAQASGAMDAYVHYVLGATIDTETRPGIRVRADGYVRVPTKAIPILEVTSFSVGLIPSQMQAITSGADAWIDENVIHMPLALATSLPPRTSAFGPGDRVFCRWTYVNGYPNTLLAATANAGDSAIQVPSALGVYPGSHLVIYDSGRSETVQVAASYVSTTAPGTTSVALAAPLQFPHETVGISVSALPPNVKKAAVLATTAFIKVRGASGLVLDSIEPTGEKVVRETGAAGDLAMARDLLKRYVLPTYI